jgi:hypothetical protein
VPDRVIDNPIINSPYRIPSRHFAFDIDGITDTSLPRAGLRHARPRPASSGSTGK